MARPCAAHPAATSSGDCAACGRPYCAACVVEDVVREQAFCSASCRDLAATTLAAQGRDPVDLVGGLHKPIRTGWQLWLRQVPRLTSWVALPLGITVGLLRVLLVDGSAADGSGRPVVYDVALALAIALGAAGSAVVLSRARLGAPDESPWAHVASRLLPWSVTWLTIGSAVLVGSLLLRRCPTGRSRPCSSRR